MQSKNESFKLFLKNVSSSSSEGKFSKSRHLWKCAARHFEEVNYLVRVRARARASISISFSLQTSKKRKYGISAKPKIKTTNLCMLCQIEFSNI
jgi:hypothetical protein